MLIYTGMNLMLFLKNSVYLGTQDIKKLWNTKMYYGGCLRNY